jgi:hypothetical protein
MCGHIAANGKSLEANITTVRLEAAMRSLVNVQSGSLRESLATLALVRALAVVGSQVNFQVWLSREARLALCALEGAMIRVVSRLVDVERRLLGERLEADETLERPLAVVSAQMDVQIGFARECGCALDALVWALLNRLQVDLFVSVER